jgi:hypothetical protein
VDGRQVGLAVDLDSPDDGEHPGRSLHGGHAGGDLALVVAVGQEELGLGGAGGAAADVGEVVGPGVHELEHVVTVLGVGHVQHDRALAHVEQATRYSVSLLGETNLVSGPSSLRAEAKVL